MTELPTWAVVLLAIAAPLAGLAGVALGGLLSSTEGRRQRAHQREIESERIAQEERSRLDDARRAAYAKLLADVVAFQGEATVLRRNARGEKPTDSDRTLLDAHVTKAMQSLYEARMLVRTERVRWHLEVLLASLTNAFLAWTQVPDALEGWEPANERLTAALDPLVDLISSELGAADFTMPAIAYFATDSAAPEDDSTTESPTGTA